MLKIIISMLRHSDNVNKPLLQMAVTSSLSTLSKIAEVLMAKTKFTSNHSLPYSNSSSMPVRIEYLWSGHPIQTFKSNR